METYCAIAQAQRKERRSGSRSNLTNNQPHASRLIRNEKREKRNERDQSSKRIKIRRKRVSRGNTGSVLQLGITKGASEFETTQKERK